MQSVKLTDDFHRQSVENDNPDKAAYSHVSLLLKSITSNDFRTPGTFPLKKKYNTFIILIN